MRYLTKAAVELGIKSLQEKQHADPDRFFLQRVANSIKKSLSSSSIGEDDDSAATPSAVSAEDGSWIDSWYNQSIVPSEVPCSVAGDIKKTN